MGRSSKLQSNSVLADLVSAGLRGEQLAYSDLYGRYRLYAWGVALRVTRNRTTAEEAVIDGFASAFQSLNRLRDPIHFPAYLASCVRNEALMSARVTRDTIQIDGLQEFLEDDVTPESIYNSAVDGNEALEAYQRLDDRQQQAVHLAYIEGVSASEAAAALRLTVNAFHQLLFRARRTLRLRFIAPTLTKEAPRACQSCNNQLAAYVSGTANVRASTMVDMHVAGCKACRERLAEARATCELLGRANGVLPNGLTSPFDPDRGKVTVPESTEPQMYHDYHRVMNVGLALAVTAGAVLLTTHTGPAGATMRTVPKLVDNQAGSQRSQRAVSSPNFRASNATSPPNWISTGLTNRFEFTESGLLRSLTISQLDERSAHVPMQSVVSEEAIGVSTPQHANALLTAASNGKFGRTGCMTRSMKSRAVTCASVFDSARITWPRQESVAT